MSTYKLVAVHDWYDSTRTTRIRCELLAGSYYCYKRQHRDAIRRASVMPGSVLRSAERPIIVLDDDGRIVDFIEGC